VKRLTLMNLWYLAGTDLIVEKIIALL